MKKIYIYRSVLFIASILAMAKVVFVQGFVLDQIFIDRASKFNNIDSVFELNDKYASLRTLTLIVYFILACGFYIISNYLNKKNRAWLLTFLIPVIAVLVGAIMTLYNQDLNNYYAIVQTGSPIETSVLSLFIQSTLRNSILGFYFFSSAAFFSTSEFCFIRTFGWTKRLNEFKAAFWITSVSFLFLLIEYLLFSIRNITSYSMLVSTTFPVMALSIFLTLLIFLTISFLTTENKIGRVSLKDILSRSLVMIVGFFGVLAISETSSLDMHWETSLTVFSGALPIYLVVLIMIFFLSWIIVKLNIGNIRSRITASQKVAFYSSQLSLLKSQINPHFLFNSLNTVYGLALEEESPKSAEGVQKLSDMMRFMLQENTADKIPLDREIKYIHDYIDFQLLRIDNKENIDLNIDIADSCNGQIAPMLLIPMIENAFKHGISMSSPSWAKISLTCDGNEVSLNVKNSMHPKTNRKEEESGIGLENVRKRLAILYPEKHLFQLYENEEQFEANIKVTLS